MQPDRIGRYRIVGELGRGGFATVYLGEDRGLDDLVAVKILAETHAADPESVARFVAEARVMRNLRAPGVVTVHDVGEHEGRPYFVMEYCDRGTLSDRLGALGRPLTVDEGLGLATAIGRAMGGLHGATPPVVHRDVKPGNLLIRHSPANPQPPVGELLAGDEELIVGDFGLAKVVDPRATKLSLIAYTRGFASPEQIRGDGTIQPSADVYSASAVVVAAMAGEVPEQVFVDSDRPFSDEAMAAAGHLRTELERGLTFDRHGRHETIAAWSTALTAASLAPRPPVPPTGPVVDPAPVTELAPHAPAPPPAHVRDEQAVRVAMSHAVEPPRSARRLGVAASVVAVLASIVVVGAFALGRNSGPSVIGPSEGLVGEELAFAVLDTQVESWSVGGQRTLDPVLRLTPSSPGRVSIDVTTTDGDATVEVDVVDAENELRIVGPAVVPLDEVTELVAGGADPAGVVWTIHGETFRQPTLEVRPSTPGTMRVELADSEGRQVVRVLTIPG